ncbi:MAG: glutamate synthase large subunit, partial [Sulfurovaceae bacterium]|nr:glutamate synthase large subunit [Sulfurovaceae bacterium]
MQDLFTSFKDNCGFGLLASIDNTPSHKNLEDAIISLERMMHRGAVAADGKSGDGSGLLVSMPKSFMAQKAQEQGIALPKQYAVAMVFNKDEKDFDIFEKYCDDNDLKIIMKREVPVDTQALGEYALNLLPTITQIFVAPNSIMSYKRFDAMVYLTRKEVEHALKKENSDLYITTFSSTTISYKGLVMPTHIREFYLDLQDEAFKISFALFHQRFSTNTLPEWRLAQPFRAIAHNGEINSVTANRFNVAIKTDSLKSTIFSKEELNRISAIIQDNMSDSASLDNFLEFLHANDMDFFKAARALLPAPWHNFPHMDGELKSFYEYTSACFEPWDGPA